MGIFTSMSLVSIALLGAISTFLAIRLWRRQRRPEKRLSRRFEETEQSLRSLKSQKKVADTATALEHVARGLLGEEVSAKLREFRDLREKAAAAYLMGPEEGSLARIPPVFLKPDPDVGLARLFFDLGARSRGAEIDVRIAFAIAGGAWVLFLLVLVLRILKV